MKNIMRTNICKICILYLVVFSFGCNNRKALDGTIDELNYLKELEKIEVPTSISDLTKKLSYYQFIQLETNSNCLIGEISKLLKYDEKFIIFDKITKSVFCFDLSGNFLHKISKQGKGPGEYSTLGDININKKKQCIELYDRAKKVILSFTMDGKFVSEQKVDMYFDSFVNIDANSYIFQKASDKINYYNFYLISGGKIKDKKVKCRGFDNTKIQNQITKNQDQFFMTHGCSKVVYSIKDKSIVPKYLVDFGDNNLPTKMLYKQEVEINDYLKLFLKSYSMMVMGFYEDDKYITFSYAKNKKLFWSIKDKKNGTVQNGNVFLFGKVIIPPMYKCDNLFYSVIDPNTIDRDKLRSQLSDLDKKFTEQGLECGSDDLNPIILKFCL